MNKTGFVASIHTNRLIKSAYNRTKAPKFKKVLEFSLCKPDKERQDSARIVLSNGNVFWYTDNIIK